MNIEESCYCELQTTRQDAQVHAGVKIRQIDSTNISYIYPLRHRLSGTLHPYKFTIAVYNHSLTLLKRICSVIDFGEQRGSRRDYKRKLFEEAKTWQGHPLEARLKSLIMVDDEDDDQPRRLISHERIHDDRRHYCENAGLPQCMFFLWRQERSTELAPVKTSTKCKPMRSSPSLPVVDILVA